MKLTHHLSSILIGAAMALVAPSLQAKLEVFACEPEWKALVEALGGELVRATSATNGFQDPHYIEARPSLIAKSRRADLLVCTGAELEIGWLPLLLRQSGNSKIQQHQPGYFLATEQVELLEKPEVMDRSMGDVHAAGNPHVHWDPYRLLTIAQALSERLQRLDAEHQSAYQQKYAAFKSQWQAAIANWEQQAKALVGQRIVVHHKSWSYLLHWLQIETIADLEPKPGIPPTSKHLTQLLASTRTDKPDFILLTNYQDDKGARWLSSKLNVPMEPLPFTVGGSRQANSLESLYDEVIARLVQVGQ